LADIARKGDAHGCGALEGQEHVGGIEVLGDLAGVLATAHVGDGVSEWLLLWVGGGLLVVVYGLAQQQAGEVAVARALSDVACDEVCEREVWRGELALGVEPAFDQRAIETGPNGAGKTTAVRILSTLLRADSGRVEVAGFDATREPAQVRRN
jgi:ABC transporter